MSKIGIILSSTRDGRFADTPARWAYEAAAERDDIDAEIVDLRDYPLPFFGEAAPNTRGATQNEVAVRWREKLAEFDGFLFVTAEYNHSVPAVLKNALDHAYKEWNRKPAAYVGYGAVGAARAIEQLRLIQVELRMAPLRSAVHIQGTDYFAVARGTTDLASIDYLNDGLEKVLDDLAWWAQALEAAREGDAKSENAKEVVGA